MLDYKSTFGPAPHELGSLVMKLFVLVTVLLIISACFLADALRRLKKQFSLDKRLVVNQKTMCLHVTALFIHTFFIVVAQYITIYAFMNPAPINKNILNISRICLFGSQSISQAIVIYLFVQFSKPVSLTKDVESDDSDSDEYELDERRQGIDGRLVRQGHVDQRVGDMLGDVGAHAVGHGVAEGEGGDASGESAGEAGRLRRVFSHGSIHWRPPRLGE